MKQEQAANCKLGSQSANCFPVFSSFTFCVEPICFCKDAPNSYLFHCVPPALSQSSCYNMRQKGDDKIDTSLVLTAAEPIISAVKGMIICVKL